MTARMCFTGKIAAGKVAARAASGLLDLIGRFEEARQAELGDVAGARAAALDAATVGAARAAGMADDVRSNAIAQATVLQNFAAYEAKVAELRETPGDLGFGNKAPPTLGKETQSTLGYAVRSMLARDPWEIAPWGNVDSLAKHLRAGAHRVFADAIEYLRPKALGFKAEATRELDFLRAAFGRSDVDEGARAAADAWFKAGDPLAQGYIDAGGKLTKRERYFPNFAIDENKVRAIGGERFMEIARANVDRASMIDFETKLPLSDVRFEQLLKDATRSILAGGAEGLPSGEIQGAGALANRRDAARFFLWKDADTWMQMAESFGTHASPFQAVVDHIDGLAKDTALLRTFGRNPDATKRFILDLFARETERLAVTGTDLERGGDKRATKINRRIESRNRFEARQFENLWAEVTGENRVPVNMTLAQGMGDVRHVLGAAQLGSALISSITDTGTVAQAARFNGLPVMDVLGRATKMMTEKGSEIFAAQMDMVADTLANAAGSTDKIMGESIRTGVAAKLANANIRAQGLRRWTAVLRGAFGLEMMAHTARVADQAFADLDPQFKAALERYGIAPAEWDLIRQSVPHEPRPGAKFLRPADVAEGGTPAHAAAAEKYARLRDTEMDYAVIEGDPVTRALLIGQSQPGTAGGEVRRSVGMYRSFPATFILMHFARGLARGWDGSRLGHGAITFLTMTALGALAMQSKEILAGRDPLSLDPSTGNGLRAWGKATLQGGGLGVFGDVLFVDQTKYGNTWASTVAGPVAGAMETVLGDFLIKNIQQAGKGQETQFLGDALYAGARHLPGSSLWFARLAFQRSVLDQLALMADHRTAERFQRIEEKAQKDWGQRYWYAPGRTEPRRAPEFNAMFGGR